jgi:hypothetical protein
MALSDEQQTMCKDVATKLSAGDFQTYKNMRALYAKISSDEDVTNMLLNVIFHLLPQSAQDHIAAGLMTEAMERYAKGQI